jgi:hypothetical protein
VGEATTYMTQNKHKRQTTKQTQKTNNHGLNRIQTSNSSKPAVADLSLRLRGLIIHFCEHSYNQCLWLTDISCYVTVMDRKKNSYKQKYRKTVTAIVTAAVVWYLEILKHLTFLNREKIN